MNHQTLPAFNDFWSKLLAKTKPEHHNWEKRPVYVRHGKASALRHAYQAVLLHPTEKNWDKVMASLRVSQKRLRKASGEHKPIPEGARWVTINPEHIEGEGHPILISPPNPDGSHTVIGGAGSRLNGMRLTGIKSEAEYAKAGKERQAAKRQEQQLRREQLRSQMGVEAYTKLQTQKAASETAAVNQKKDAEKAFIEAVAKQQGWDSSLLEVPKEHLSDVSDPKIAQRVTDKHHQALLTAAQEVVSRTKSIVQASYEEVAKDALGQIGLSEIARMSTGDTGKGYQADVAQMAAENGLTPEKSKRIAQDTSWRGFLSRSDGDIESARSKEESVHRLHAGAAASRAEVKQTVAAAGEEDAGPEAVRRLDTTPKAASLPEAVELLKAHAQCLAAQSHAKAALREIAEVEDAAKLPKSIMVPVKPMSDGDALKAVADNLNQESMTKAMMRLVSSTNDMEDEEGTLQQHYSVGQAAGMNTIAQAVSGVTVDPLILDTLGVGAVAAALSNHWQQSLSPEEFKEIGKTLGSQHVATQEKIANEGVDRANAYMDEADKIDTNVEPESAEEVEAVLSSMADRVSLLRMARESAGVARGRLEAAAAINYAMMKPKSAVRVSMGPIASADAAERLFAIGLNDPSKYDENGNMTHEGDFTLHTDGTNRILELHKAGLAKLVQPADTHTQERAARSSFIKSGGLDDPDWLPAGLADRPTTSFDVDPLVAHSIDNVMHLSDSDTPETMAAALKVHIGARINAGADPFTVLSDITAAGTIGGLGLSDRGEENYDKAVQSVAPAWSGKLKTPEDHKAYEAHREKLRETLSGYADDHIAYQKSKGLLTTDAASLARQRVPQTAEARDSLLQAVVADPRTQNAFLPLSTVNKDAIRSYAMEKLLPLTDEQKTAQGESSEPVILSKVSPEQAQVFRQWEAFKKEKGANGVYAAIQQAMQEDAETNSGGLFGEEEEGASPENSLATVDLDNPLAVLAAAKENGNALGYSLKINPHTGEREFLDLVPGMKFYTGEQGDTGQVNTEHSIIQDAKRRIKGYLRSYHIGTTLGRSAVAQSGWNPDSVITTDNRWTKFVDHIGGMSKAVRAVQDFMKGDVAQRFAAAHAKRTGQQFTMAYTPIADHEAYMEARVSPEAIEARRAEGRSAQARAATRGPGGKLAKEEKEGVRKDRAGNEKRLLDSSPKLIGDTETKTADKQVNTQRATLGSSAEKAIASMMPYLPVDRAVDTSQRVDMAGKAINRQRATKLILENERQGCNLAAGAGKSVCLTGAFTEAHRQGKANRALFVVPSNIVGQFNSEFTKFIDPSEGLRWHANPGASADERQDAMGNDGYHMVVTTPEALREDVTGAVAEHLGISKQEASDRIEKSPTRELDDLIHTVLEEKGWSFNFHCEDEGHRLLSRSGKADSGMARIADSMGRKSRYYVYSTADIVKNDASEAHSVLSKIAPEKYHEGNKEEFLRKYGRQTVASGIALRREMEPYIYADKVDTGVEHTRTPHMLPLSESQQADYAKVTKAARQAKQAKAKGDRAALAKAIAVLSPTANLADPETLDRMAKSLGTLTETALNRVVNTHSDSTKLDWVNDYVGEHKEEPTVIFAHNRDAVKAITERLKAQGHKVATITGNMNTAGKDKAKEAFAGSSPSVNVLVCSDAAAMGANLQRGYHMVMFDSPQTSMLQEQRVARCVRTGQKNAVSVHELISDCAYDRRNRRRLERKSALRELMTSPAEMIDDSGLAHRVQEAKVRAGAKEENVQH